MNPSVSPRKYRSADQWQSLILQWQDSRLSAKAFCQQHGLGYASFCQWRKRLTREEADLSSESGDFVDLSSLALKESIARLTLNIRFGGWFELSIQR